MRYELKSFGIWAFVKVAFFLNLIIGFVFGLVYSAFLGLFLAASSAMPFEEMSEFPLDSNAIGPFLVIFLPFVFAIGGAICYTLFGLVIVGAYNLVARLVGGFEVTLEPVGQSQPGSPLPAPPPVAESPRYQPPPPPPSGSPPPPPTTPPLIDPTPDRNPENR